MHLKKTVWILFLFILIFPFLYAETNLTMQQQADLCLNESSLTIELMIKDGFNIQRLNDTLEEAKTIYASQIVPTIRTKKPDFTLVIAKCLEITSLREQAILVREDFEVLKKVYNDSVIKVMNTSKIDSFMAKIEDNIRSERYELVPNLIDEAYDEISSLRASYTALNVFYANTVTGIKQFLLKKNQLFLKSGIENWKILSTLILILIILFFVYRLQIMKWLIKTKIDSMQTRKKTIKGLIMNLQKDYFQYGNIPEETYNIRTKKFAEIIRDIDSKIPLLQAELARIEGLKKYKAI